MSSAQRALCEDCGLCCDGTLFESVEVEAADERALGRRRLTIVATAQGSKLPLPCACLAGALCTIYEERPGRCRSFECELLTDVNRGVMTVARARAIIDDVRARRHRVAEDLPKGTAWWTALARLRRGGVASPLRDELTAIERLVELRFWP